MPEIAQTLILKYRPQDFDELIGHDSILAALQRAMAGSTCPHSYLFTGPAGIGKTSSARIVANQLKCTDVIEIDAASHSGVDDMRALVELGNHMSLTGAGRRAFIIDECHTLSKSAWQAILKILEEPPPHLFIMLCTTETIKVPETIIQRCYHVNFRSLKPDSIAELLETVCMLEEWEVHPDVLNAVIQNANGSPRKALGMIQAVHDVDSREEVARIIALTDASEPLIELCQFMLRGQIKWVLLQPIIERIDDSDFEEGLIGAGRYIAAAMTRSKNEKEAARAWQILDAITFPTTTYDKKLHFLTAIGRVIFGGQSV